jgi:protein TonB
MFETAMLSSGPAKRRVWSACAGFAGQVLLVGVALAAPMIWPQVTPHVGWVTRIAPPGVPVGPLKGDPGAARHARVAPRPPSSTRPFYEPVSYPVRPAPIVDAPELLAGPPGNSVVGGFGKGDGNYVVGGFDLGAQQYVAPPKPPEPVRRAVAAPAPTPAPAPPPRISRVELATPLHRVEPIYPKLAIAAHVQGVVQLMGVLGTDGRIRELKVLSGHPMLVRAAVEAVQQWIYAPTLLNGEPVEVQAPIEVKFILNR